MKKLRIDTLLVENELAPDIETARRYIMAGLVIADDIRHDKASDLVRSNAVLRLKERLAYVSRGGFKLKSAVDKFKLDMQGKSVLDIGSSTGGFTDVALKNGAVEVFAVDVGKGLIHESLRQHEKVRLIENTNFKNIEFHIIGKKVDFIVTDVSFISLEMIIPKCVQFCKDGTVFIPLIKPQFEAKREEINVGGIVTDIDVHKRTCEKVIKCAENFGFKFQQLEQSPITGAKGNVEFLAYFIY